LPFELGIHKCHVIFTDEQVGEVQYTIIGKAELPEILDTFQGDCNSEEPYSFKKVLNYRNDKLEQARNQINEKDKKDAKNRNKDSALDLNADDKAKKPVAVVNEPKMFEVEISNPFFSGPSSIMLADLSAGPKAIATGSKGKDGKVSGEFLADQNFLSLNSNPSKPASYTCYVILKSVDRTDIRLYEYKLTAIPQKIKAQLEFRVPARGVVTQDIPIVNNSSSEWKVSAEL